MTDADRPSADSGTGPSDADTDSADPRGDAPTEVIPAPDGDAALAQSRRLLSRIVAIVLAIIGPAAGYTGVVLVLRDIPTMDPATFVDTVFSSVGLILLVPMIVPFGFAIPFRFPLSRLALLGGLAVLATLGMALVQASDFLFTASENARDWLLAGGFALVGVAFGAMTLARPGARVGREWFPALVLFPFGLVGAAIVMALLFVTFVAPGGPSLNRALLGFLAGGLMPVPLVFALYARLGFLRDVPAVTRPPVYFVGAIAIAATALVVSGGLLVAAGATFNPGYRVNPEAVSSHGDPLSVTSFAVDGDRVVGFYLRHVEPEAGARSSRIWLAQWRLVDGQLQADGSAIPTPFEGRLLAAVGPVLVIAGDMADHDGARPGRTILIAEHSAEGFVMRHRVVNDRGTGLVNERRAVAIGGGFVLLDNQGDRRLYHVGSGTITEGYTVALPDPDGADELHSDIHDMQALPDGRLAVLTAFRLIVYRCDPSAVELPDPRVGSGPVIGDNLFTIEWAHRFEFSGVADHPYSRGDLENHEEAMSLTVVGNQVLIQVPTHERLDRLVHYHIEDRHLVRAGRLSFLLRVMLRGDIRLCGDWLVMRLRANGPGVLATVPASALGD